MRTARRSLLATGAAVLLHALLRPAQAATGHSPADHARAAEIVSRHGHDSLDMAINRIRASLEECVGVLRALPAAAWANAGQHPIRGQMTIAQLVDAFLVSHAEEHADQIQASVKSLDASRTSPH